MKFSIITINFNNRDGLRKTIESVVNQTFQDYEYIIIDGGSTDGSVEVIKEYADRIDYWVSEPDKGIYNAMNKGILKAHGEYLNFMNSGDFFNNPNVLTDVAKELKADIGVGAYFKGNNTSAWYYPYTDATFFHLFKGTFNHQSSFIKHKLFNNCLYNENLKIVADWEFFVKKLILNNHSFQTLNVYIVNYDANGISNNMENTYQKERQEVIHKLIPQRIINDYDSIKNIEYELWNILPQIPHGYKAQHIICKILRLTINVLNHISISKLLKKS